MLDLFIVVIVVGEPVSSSTNTAYVILWDYF